MKIIGPVEQAPSNRRYVAFAAGLVALMTVLAALDRLGVPETLIRFVMFASPLVAFIFVGLAYGTVSPNGYLVGDRNVPAGLNGLAIGASIIGGSLFIGLADALRLWGAEGYFILAALTGGLYLAGFVFAPYLRRTQALTLPDFFGRKYNSSTLRLLGALVLVGALLPLFLAEVEIAGWLFGALFGLSRQAGVFSVLAILLLTVLLGGMRSLTWGQAAQAVTLAAAFALPAFYLWLNGDEGSSFAASVSDAGIAARYLPAAFQGMLSSLSFVELGTLTASILLGTACLPHILTRSLVAASPGVARRSFAWGLAFLAAFFAVAIVYSRQIQWQPTAEEPLLWGNAVGGIPPALSGLVWIGAFAATLSTAAGTLVILGGTLAHDVYSHAIDRMTPASRKVFAARLAVVGLCLFAGWFALKRPVELATLVAMSFSLAASGYFPVLVLSIWTRGISWTAALAGMVAGIAGSGGYFAGVEYLGMDELLGVSPLASAAFGVPAGFLASLFFHAGEWAHRFSIRGRPPKTAAKSI
ncbi:hypothetical protein GR183_13420 [Stappia sp. GBMRC 2046]|uniref:Cation/acetate symporter n=1 Tax=Stappia sediminis TaxID=2692190 RepID=A0A7X3LVK7_9HYPH|nr:hypothetical protein [Stappia sediminis]MXN65907.1 hypothetical protein [Stappia sediminis]